MINSISNVSGRLYNSVVSMIRSTTSSTKEIEIIEIESDSDSDVEEILPIIATPSVPQYKVDKKYNLSTSTFSNRNTPSRSRPADLSSPVNSVKKSPFNATRSPFQRVGGQISSYSQPGLSPVEGTSQGSIMRGTALGNRLESAVKKSLTSTLVPSPGKVSNQSQDSSVKALPTPNVFTITKTVSTPSKTIPRSLTSTIRKSNTQRSGDSTQMITPIKIKQNNDNNDNNDNDDNNNNDKENNDNYNRNKPFSKIGDKFLSDDSPRKFTRRGYRKHRDDKLKHNLNGRPAVSVDESIKFVRINPSESEDDDESDHARSAASNELNHESNSNGSNGKTVKSRVSARYPSNTNEREHSLSDQTIDGKSSRNVEYQPYDTTTVETPSENVYKGPVNKAIKRKSPSSSDFNSKVSDKDNRTTSERRKAKKTRREERRKQRRKESKSTTQRGDEHEEAIVQNHLTDLISSGSVQENSPEYKEDRGEKVRINRGQEKILRAFAEKREQRRQINILRGIIEDSSDSDISTHESWPSVFNKTNVEEEYEEGKEEGDENDEDNVDDRGKIEDEKSGGEGENTEGNKVRAEVDIYRTENMEVEVDGANDADIEDGMEDDLSVTINYGNDDSNAFSTETFSVKGELLMNEQAIAEDIKSEKLDHPNRQSKISFKHPVPPSIRNSQGLFVDDSDEDDSMDLEKIEIIGQTELVQESEVSDNWTRNDEHKYNQGVSKIVPTENLTVVKHISSHSKKKHGDMVDSDDTSYSNLGSTESDNDIQSDAPAGNYADQLAANKLSRDVGSQGGSGPEARDDYEVSPTRTFFQSLR